jgi:3-methyl-2-oxobutanoate hydroxymethyltransferase
MTRKKITILDFQKKKLNNHKITMLTAYDQPMAERIDSAGIDAVLVGDSVGMVLLGYDSTVYVTIEDMLHHIKAVKKGVKNSFLIGDMPFLSYQVSDEDAVKNAGRFIKEGGCDAIKVEGGGEISPRVKAIVNAGIPVLGHIGLTPQSVNKLGGYRVQGKDPDSADSLLKDAEALSDAGCFGLILECVPSVLAEKITKKISIPTIGIGAGKYCDGQVLVTHDIIGYLDKFSPKFVKKYADTGRIIQESIDSFKKEVLSGKFPGEEHSF